MIGKPEDLVKFLFNQDKEKLFEIKEVKKKRSLNANSYYWTMLNELADRLGASKEELHFRLLKNYSQRYEILVPSEYTISGIEYYEKKSTIEKNGKKYNVYYVYTPSHELNSKGFSELLNGLIEECKQQGIPTLDDLKIKELKYEN